MILTRTGETTRDLHWGKFDSPMAVYLYDLMLEGCEGDEWDSDGNGAWFHRFGRRILHGDDRGFVGVVTYPTEDEAVRLCALQSAHWNTEEEEDA